MIKAKLAMSLVAVGAMPCTCTMTLTGIQAPARVAPGEVFDVSLFGTHTFHPCYSSEPGCVLQLPNGFVIVSPQTGPGSLVVRDDPTLLGRYQAEPGHYLASFSGAGGSGFTVSVQAPAQWTGPSEIAVALAHGHTGSGFSPSDPFGETNFANIGSANRHILTRRTARAGFERVSGISEVQGGVADVDGDGRDDLVGLRSTVAPSGETMGLSIEVAHFGPGGWLSTSTALPPNAPSGTPACGDIDGDGVVDLIAAGSLGTAVWFGRGDGSFLSAHAWIPGSFGTATVEDVNGDGRGDLVYGTYSGPELNVVLSLGRHFAPATRVSVFGTYILQRYVGDITGDGLVDIVLGTTESSVIGNGLEILVGDGAGGWSHLRGPVGVTGPSGLVDIDGDGHREILTAGASGAVVSSWRSASGWSVQPLQLPAMVADVRHIDLDGDARSDLLAVESLRGSSGTVDGLAVRLFRNLGAGAFAEVVDPGISARGSRWLLTGDVDGDALDDVVNLNLEVVWLNRLPGAARFGAGCGAGGVTPRIDPAGVAVRGNSSFGLELGGLLPGGFGVVWLGESRLETTVGLPGLPFDLTGTGAPGCWLLADPALVRWVAADGSGVGRLPLALPGGAAWERFAFFAQGAALVPGANALGLATSAGLVVRIE